MVDKKQYPVSLPQKLAEVAQECSGDAQRYTLLVLAVAMRELNDEHAAAILNIATPEGKPDIDAIAKIKAELCASLTGWNLAHLIDVQ